MVEVFGQGGTSPRVSRFGSLGIPILQDIPVIGPALFDQSLLVYLMYVLIPVTFFVVFRTPFGLRLRATGEVPRSGWIPPASASPRMRYYGVGLSGILAALGGAYLSMGLLSAFTEGMTNGRGFIALAAPDLRPLETPSGPPGAALLFGFAQAHNFPGRARGCSRRVSPDVCPTS